LNLRTKLILVFVVLALLPLAALSIVGYRGSTGAVEGRMRANTDERATRTVQRIERALDAQESGLLKLSKADALGEFVRASRAARPIGADRTKANGGTDVPDVVRANIDSYIRDNRDYIESVTCLAPSGQPLFRARWKDDADGGGTVFQTTDFVSGEVRYDERVWKIQDSKALRSSVTKDPYGAGLRVTVPIIDSNTVAPDTVPVAALVVEINLDDVIKEADERKPPGTPVGTLTGAALVGIGHGTVIALDNTTDTIIYHTNGALSHRAASDVLPYFKDVAARMKSGAEGFAFYDAPDGERWLAAFRQVDSLNLSLAVSENYTSAVAPVRRPFLFAVAIASVACLVALALLLLIARQEARGIERVSRGASAIASGNLDQRIKVSASGETQGLAESFNAMSDRLRELIAREAESRQFESFLRISAMISHDLKNAIAGLSMLVANMERQFHREEFRADAIESLREATEKLKRTVARLSEPAKTLSGEYRLNARPADLIPVIRRVLAANAEPSRPLYDIEVSLPDNLLATVEPERIENVVENLVINALEAMGAKGGTLTVKAGALDGDYVFINVADTGTGMSEEFIKTRLFRPFSTTKNKGIGLGLFTCREIVEAHGGRLEVESKTGVGTLFRVVLPSRLFRSGEQRAQP
jgi:signal transduction histidine kinase